MNAYPSWRREVTVETWPSAVSDFFALRDFRVLDAEGAPLAVAASSWTVIDLARRKPVPPPDFILSIHHGSPGRALDDPFSKLPEPDVFSHSKVLEVRNADLDLNRHLNFVKSIELGLEAVPAEVRALRSMSGLEVSFRAEGRKDDRLVIRPGSLSGGEPLRLGHVLLRERDGLELTRMTSTWERNAPVAPPSRPETS